MLTRRRALALVPGVAAGGLPLRGAFAQESWPSRPIVLVVPGQPGSNNDLTARLLATELSQSLGVPVVVDNKNGGRGAIAMQHTARARPDGYSFVVVIASVAVIAPAITRTMAYDLKDFVPVSLYAGLPTVMLVPRDSPLHSVDELVASARKNPGVINYGMGATMFQLAMELLNQQAGIQMVGVPYRGPAESTKDLMAGRIQVGLEGLASAVPLVKSGQLRPIAMLATRRHLAFPDVPTMEELGYRDFDFDGWAGIMAPAATPRRVVRRFNAAIAAAAASEALQQRFASMMVTPLSSSSEEFAARMAHETIKYERIARAAHIEKT